MGKEPNEDDMPIDRDDLSYEVQVVFKIFDRLQSEWDGFNGLYLGKNISNFDLLCREYNVPDYIRKFALDLIPIIDNFVSEEVARKAKARNKDAASGSRR